jgi:hypothetical protein
MDAQVGQLNNALPAAPGAEPQHIVSRGQADRMPKPRTSVIRRRATRALCWGLVFLLCAATDLVSFRPLEVNPLAPQPPRPAFRHLANLLAQQTGGQAFAVLNTGSMEPVITRQDLVVTVPVAFEALEPNDVIVFRRGERLTDRLTSKKVVHRIVALEPCDRRPVVHVKSTGCWKLRTQGDALARPDVTLVNRKMLLGKVAYAIDGQTGDIRNSKLLSLQAPGLIPAALESNAASL